MYLFIITIKIIKLMFWKRMLGNCVPLVHHLLQKLTVLVTDCDDFRSALFRFFVFWSRRMEQTLYTTRESQSIIMWREGPGRQNVLKVQKGTCGNSQGHLRELTFLIKCSPLHLYNVGAWNLWRQGEVGRISQCRYRLFISYSYVI